MVLGVVREQSNPTFEAVLAARPLERRVELSALLAAHWSPGVAGRSVLANHAYYEAVAAVRDTRKPPEITQVGERQWEEARRFLPMILGLAQRPKRTRAEVVAAARVLGCGPTHVYAPLRRYLADPRLTSLFPRPPRGPGRLFCCTPEIDALINEVIETVYLTRQRARISDVEAEVRGAATS
jgi:hypothetical protein